MRVDHSTAGAAILGQEALGIGPPERLAAEIVGYAILGHHAGLPDMLAHNDACARSRIVNFKDGLAPK